MSASEIKYLIAIFNLTLGRQSVKPVDIAAALEYSRASVSRMLDQFEIKGIVLRNKDKTISFTGKGEETASRYYRAYLKVKDSLTGRFCCNENIASKDAVRILSNLSPANFDKLV